VWQQCVVIWGLPDPNLADVGLQHSLISYHFKQRLHYSTSSTLLSPPRFDFLSGHINLPASKTESVTMFPRYHSTVVSMWVSMGGYTSIPGSPTQQQETSFAVLVPPCR